MEPVTLSDGRVTLRPWMLQDAPAVTKLVQDPAISRYTAVVPHQTLQDTQNWLMGRSRGWASGADLQFAICDAHELKPLGAIGLTVSQDDPAVGAIGYWLGASSRGQGFMRAAVALVVEWAFEELYLARLEITTHTDNESSQRVALASGFQREGVLRGYRNDHGLRADLVMFGRLATD